MKFHFGCVVGKFAFASLCVKKAKVEQSWFFSSKGKSSEVMESVDSSPELHEFLQELNVSELPMKRTYDSLRLEGGIAVLINGFMQEYAKASPEEIASIRQADKDPYYYAPLSVLDQNPYAFIGIHIPGRRTRAWVCFSKEQVLGKIRKHYKGPGVTPRARAKAISKIRNSQSKLPDSSKRLPIGFAEKLCEAMRVGYLLNKPELLKSSSTVRSLEQVETPMSAPALGLSRIIEINKKTNTLLGYTEEDLLDWTEASNQEKQ